MPYAQDIVIAAAVEIKVLLVHTPSQSRIDMRPDCRSGCARSGEVLGEGRSRGEAAAEAHLAQQEGAHRRGHEQKQGNEQLTQGESAVGGMDDGREQQAPDAQRRGFRRAVQPHEEIGEANEPERPHHYEQAADQQQRGDEEIEHRVL
ncbi:MAG TPA: hypothetical protein VLA99_01460, partial [Nitrospiraceae bacterium]|nr:hypothetical protein [Nitrospiraceae bacterium]